MIKKVSIVAIVLMMAVALYSCGGAKQSAQVDPQVAELQKQIADLQQQVNQQTQQTQVNQQAQVSQQIAQTQASAAQQNTQVQGNQQVQQNTNVAQGMQANGMMGYGNQTANITMDQAKQIATQNAGLDVNSVTYIKTIQDYDDFYLKWEIDFVANNMKYEYDISATDGTILKAEREGVAYQGYVPPVNAGQQAVQGNVQQGGYVGGVQGTTQGISVEQAKTAAVQHAGFNTSNVTFVKQKYDFDDGIAKWEIDFVVNTQKYEYEINVANGSILKYKVESVLYD